jgi:hypothetical protein
MLENIAMQTRVIPGIRMDNSHSVNYKYDLRIFRFKDFPLPKNCPQEISLLLIMSS